MLCQVIMNSRGTVGTLSACKYFGDLYSETAKATVVTTEDSELVMVPLELIDAIRCLIPSLVVLCVFTLLVAVVQGWW